jgi:predicted regulator of Ras-like GTPase activity (Roadblock/LC7/MglB family)
MSVWKGDYLSINSLLEELVECVEGATGAIIVTVDGEAVSWSAAEESERLRLRSAYVAVVMQAFRASSGRAGLGHLKSLVVEYQGATLIAQEIDIDCSVILELKAGASVSRAIYRMQNAATKLREEIAA